MEDDGLIHVTKPGDPSDPRFEREEAPEGVVIHYSPSLHPDDLTVHKGIPVTTVSRTLIDCAEVMDEDELREIFVNARRKGMLDSDEYAAARGRVEWRPSLEMLDRVAADFVEW